MHSCKVENHMKGQTAEQIQARIVDFVNHDMLTELKHVNLTDDFDEVMKAIPEDKRLEVIYARDAADRQVTICRGAGRRKPTTPH